MLAYHLHHQRLRHVLVVHYLPRESSKKEVGASRVLVMGESKVIRYLVLEFSILSFIITNCQLLLSIFSISNWTTGHLENQQEEVDYATLLRSQFLLKKLFFDKLGNSRTRPIWLPGPLLLGGGEHTPFPPSPSPHVKWWSSWSLIVIASCARDANNVSCKRQELGTSRCETTLKMVWLVALVLWTVVLLFFLQPTWINIKMAPVWNSTTWNGFNWRCQNIFWSSWKNKYLNGRRLCNQHCGAEEEKEKQRWEECHLLGYANNP